MSLVRNNIIKKFNITLKKVKFSSCVNSTSNTLPQFTVGSNNGFLPRQVPLDVLPKPFEKLESLLQRMPIKTREGTEGLLIKGTFGESLLRELPDHTKDIENITDSRLLAALFRDYTFAASAYLLEPCRKLFNNIYFKHFITIIKI